MGTCNHCHEEAHDLWWTNDARLVCAVCHARLDALDAKRHDPRDERITTLTAARDAALARVAALEESLRETIGLLAGCDRGHDLGCECPATHKVGFVADDSEAHDGIMIRGAMCEAHAAEWVALHPGRTSRRDDWRADRIERAEKALAAKP